MNAEKRDTALKPVHYLSSVFMHFCSLLNPPNKPIFAAKQAGHATMEKTQQRRSQKPGICSLKHNVDFEEINPLCVPGQNFDSDVFFSNAHSLKEAPFLSRIS